MSDGTLPVGDETSLSLTFHLNSEPWLNADAYEGGRPGTPLSIASGPPRPLPAARDSALHDLLRARRSCRAFERRTMALAALADLLDAAAGMTERSRLADGGTYLRRGAPSAGGLFPLDAYVFARDVEDLPDGIHRYDSVEHGLHELARGDVAGLLAGALYAYPFAQAANAVIAFAATFRRTQAKYGPRGYRYILLEAGHCAQDVCLRAAELGLGTLCIGGFLDSEINRILALDPRRAGVVYIVAAGHPAPA